MPITTVKQLITTLIDLKLVSEADLDECLNSASSNLTVDGAFSLLTRNQLLTSFQEGRLRADNTDGMVLGNIKLMYQNASGSFARVYRGESVKDGRMLGVKVLRQRWAKDPEMVAQFRREALVCKRFKHPNVVPIYDVGSEGENHFFTMEFVEGGNLREFLNIRKRLSPVDATRCLKDLADGLDYALRMGATHRDLKLTNVLMSMNGVAKLVDFGLAGDERVAAEGSDGGQRALEYAAIENATKAPANDPRSDLFFVGTIFYELLSGKPPYPRTRDREERSQISRYTNIPSILTHVPDVPKPVVGVLEKLLKINPRERYQRAGELARDARQLLEKLQPKKTAKTTKKGNGKTAPVVMCVENRTKRQDIIREYFTQKGFRVLFMNDVDRAIQRFDSNNSPDCLVFMGETIGDGIKRAFLEAQKIADRTKRACIALLSTKQSDMQEGLAESKTAKVLVQPVSLRELRKHIHHCLQRSRDV